LYEKGRRNFLDVRVVTNDVFFENLPPELERVRLLQISDLHLDLEPELTPILVKLLADVSYDLAVITGDYRDDTKGSITDCLKYMEDICGALKQPVGSWGIMIASNWCQPWGK